MRLWIRVILLGCVIASFGIVSHAKSPESPKNVAAPAAPPVDALVAVESILPKDWVVEENEPSVPLMWRGSKPCRHFTMTNTKRLKSVQNQGFAYNPFHDVWLCPVDFWGKSEKTCPAERKLAARYVADGNEGILFALSLGSEDWIDPAGSVADKLGLKKPAYDSIECENVMKAIRSRVIVTEVFMVECGATTSDGVFINLSTDVQIRDLEMDKMAGMLIDAVKKQTPGKKRVMVQRSFGGKVDFVISAYIAVF